jgi:hypothetical protein
LSDLARASEHDQNAARAASRVLATVSRARPAATPAPAASAPAETAATRAASPPEATRGDVLLASKSDGEC